MRKTRPNADSTSGHRATLCTYAELDALPEDGANFFADPVDDLFASRLWFKMAIAHALPSGVVPRLVVCRERGAVFALLPLQSRSDGSGLQSLTNPYTCLFRPLFTSCAHARMAGQMMGQLCRAVPTVRMDAMEENGAGLEDFVAGLREEGLFVRRFDHFGNWYEPVAGVTFEKYLSNRPGQLRSTLRRKMARTELACEFEIVVTTEALEPAIAVFEMIHSRSWKPPEPFPTFNGALMRAAFDKGLLRFGILHGKGKPIAAQFWVVSGGRATVLKLVHDSTFTALSPGTVLTALMIRDILDRDAISEVDFGRGDDPYKKLWTSQRRQRVGLMISNPRRLAGMAEIGRSCVGSMRKRLLPQASSRREG